MNHKRSTRSPLIKALYHVLLYYVYNKNLATIILALPPCRLRDFPPQLVEGAGGARLDDAKEIAAGVASVIKHLDLNADHTLSRSDLLTYWRRLGEQGV